jgi:hypothetical protein
LKLGAPAVDTILVEDVLATLTSKMAVMKIDVETLECKVSRTLSITFYYIIHWQCEKFCFSYRILL